MSAEVPVVLLAGSGSLRGCSTEQKFPAGGVYVSDPESTTWPWMARSDWVEARYQRDREPTLRRINLDIEKLRLFLRLSHEQRDSR